MIRLGECKWILVIFYILFQVSVIYYPPISLVFAGLFVYTLYFFRDPKRVVPSEKNNIICPADGTVLYTEDFSDPYVGKAKRVAIFMSVLNVHVNRAPISGTIISNEHTPGKKVVAYLMGDLEARERNRIEIEGEIRVAMIQYSGVLARRIVTWIKKGDEVKAGDKVGMIKFGSRVDVIMPESFKLNVVKDEKVYAGETIVGRING